jgi:hypothetical protein
MIEVREDFVPACANADGIGDRGFFEWQDLFAHVKTTRKGDTPKK